MQFDATPSLTLTAKTHRVLKGTPGAISPRCYKTPPGQPEITVIKASP